MISPHFPPDSSAGTHRVRLIAPHLAACGWEPTVLTVDARDYDGRLDSDLERSVPAGLRIVRTRAWRPSLSRLAGIGDLGLRAYTGMRRAAAWLLADVRFDTVFITIYPAYTAMLGPWLKRRFGVPFVLDYQDPWVGEWGRSVGPGSLGRPDLKSRLSRGLASRLEPVALAAADGVVAVSRSTYEQALARNPGAEPLVTDEIPIGWDERDLDFARTLPRRHAGFLPGDGLVHLTYVGTLLPTGIETLRALLAGIQQLRRESPDGSRIRLHFFGTSNQRSEHSAPRVLPVARDLGVDDVVTELPERLDYFDALRVLADSTAVVVIGSRERHYTASKVFPALLSGRPVFGAFHEDSPAAALLRSAGPGVRVVTYSDASPAAEHAAAMKDQLAALLATAGPVEIPRAALAPFSAAALAARLARVFERVTAAAPIQPNCSSAGGPTIPR